MAHGGGAGPVIWVDFGLAAVVIFLVFFMIWVKRQSRKITQEADEQKFRDSLDKPSASTDSL